MPTIPRLPWDLWAAIALAIVMALSAIFEPASVILTAAVLAACAYVVINVFSSRGPPS